MTRRLTQAPLFYVLAQVKFNQLMQLKSFVPEIQEKFRRQGFPDVTSEVQSVVHINSNESDNSPKVSNSSTNRWSFMNANRTEGFMLTVDSFIYHTTNYKSSDDLIEKVKLGLSVLHEVVVLNYFERVGLRFLDAVIEAGNHKLDDYLKPGLLGLYNAGLNGEPQHSYSESALMYEQGMLVSKVFRTKLDNQPALFPGELAPLSLELNQKYQRLTGEVAILDTDHFHIPAVRNEFSVEEVLGVIRSLKVNVQEAFEKMVTNFALEQWR